MTNKLILADYLTLADAAAGLGVCTRTLKRWRALGYGPKPVRAGKKILYHQDDIATWLGRQREPSAAD